jgi:hypothetical protein
MVWFMRVQTTLGGADLAGTRIVMPVILLSSRRHSFGEGDVPICPKCGKLISGQRYSRHLKRCGVSHKKRSHVLDHPENFYMKI